MTTTRIHGSNIATQWQKILTDYAYLSDDSDSSRGISQIAPEERENSSEESNETSEESNETSEESNETSEESTDKSEEFRDFFGRKSTISPEIFENSFGEIELAHFIL